MINRIFSEPPEDDRDQEEALLHDPDAWKGKIKAASQQPSSVYEGLNLKNFLQSLCFSGPIVLAFSAYYWYIETYDTRNRIRATGVLDPSLGTSFTYKEKRDDGTPFEHGVVTSPDQQDSPHVIYRDRMQSSDIQILEDTNDNAIRDKGERVYEFPSPVEAKRFLEQRLVEND